MIMETWFGIARVFSSVNDMEKTLSEKGEFYLTGSPAAKKLENYLSHFYGADTLIVDKGRNAILATVLALTVTGDTVAVSTEIYPGTRAMFKDLETRKILKVIWFDPIKTDIFDMMHPLTGK